MLLTVSLLGIAACGDDNGDEGGTTAAPDVETTATTAGESDEAQPAKVNLERFLLRDGEEPGFKRIGAPRTDTGVEAFVQGGDVPDDEAQRLRRAGFTRSRSSRSSSTVATPGSQTCTCSRPRRARATG